MASIDHIPPPMTAYAEPTTPKVTAPPMASRQDSLMSVDMHIPGAWNGTNPGTPAPIGEDFKYFGETLKTVPGTVQNYLPAREQVASGGSTILNKAAAIVPASVMNTATNVLPKSMQPTMSPTAADANPPTHPTDLSNEHPITTTTNTVDHKELESSKTDAPSSANTLMDKAAGILPASVVGAAAAYLPASMTGNTTSAVQESNPNATTATTGNTEEALKKTVSPEETNAVDEAPASTTWTEKAKSILPVGAVGATAAAYLPSTLSPKTTADDAQKPAPTGEEEGLNAPLPALPSAADPAAEVPKKDALLMGSSVSPDADVQEALSKAANPHEYKSEIIPPMNTYPSTAPSLPPKEDQKSIESTQAVGGTTPMTPNSYEAEGDGYPAKSKSGVSGLAALAAVGGVGAIAVDHSLKDQREPALNPHDGSSRLDDGIARPNEPAKDSFIHVVIPATPGAGLHEQEPLDKKAEKHARRGSLSSPEKLKKRDRSGSISAGEASPSSPSKSGMFSGIRKLTKKRDTKGHERNASHGDDAPPVPAHGDSLDTRDSNSSGPSPTGAVEEKKDRNVLHKDPPAHHVAAGAGGEEVESPTTTNYHNEGSGSASKRDKDGTSGMLANPFSPNSPSASSPSKVGFREKMKGEFMVVQGKLKRDEGLKEAGEKMKKGTL